MAATDEGIPRVDHPLLTPGFIERRLYQIQLAGKAKTAHTLVCLPTGLGKTTVSLLVTAERLNDLRGKALFLAPTKPLVEQHAEFYRDALEIPDEEIVVFTGEVRPDDRAALWDDATIVIATPQVVENDLVGGRVSLSDVTHLTFDECHRATGDYSYVYIAERYHGDAEDPLVTGMSASPGGDEEAILEVCENLGITEVEVMTEDDSDVAEYTHDTEVEWKRIEVPEEIIEIRDALNEVVKDRLEKLKELGVLDSARVDISRKELFGVRSELQKLIQNDQSEGYQGMSIHAEVMKIKHAVEVVESQGVEALEAYFERLRNEARSSGASKASQRLVSEPKVREAMRKADAYDDLHPKLSETRRLAIETLIEGGSRVIVFTEYRDTAETLTEFLSEHVDARRFVGQGDKEGSSGMTQKEQREVLDDFRDGEFDVLVSTSVAEEGLDVPEVDLVLFYEPVPTAIRAIQRKGRTGRQDEGRVVVLLAEDTRDEAYFWISRRREKEMESELRKLKGVADEVEEQLDPSQRQLADFDAAETGDEGSEENGSDDLSHGLESYASEAEGESGEEDADGEVGSEDAGEVGVEAATPDPDGGIEIVADQRELDSTIARDLSTREGIETRLETLEVGDYVLSDRVAVERKSVTDFLDTLVGGDRSVFEQVGDMARFYSRPVVIIEGEGLYDERNVHPNAIRGALASLAIDFGTSVLRTDDEADTADLLAVIAGREQETADREVSVHGKKSSKTLAEQQEYVVGSIADIGPVTARSLLAEFGSVEAVLTASEEELLAAEGVGEVTADRIREVVASDYDR
ncbi:DEAD/DEAH box helicase [Halalkalicoccus tibetensis]|uniref:DEAD/DEAH box helicase n=1 Tax=Halalkalicoccus tibetensis TaxID=175632 RepID=A0ABD5V1H7_9EURY